MVLLRGPVGAQDGGTDLGNVDTIDAVGAGVTATKTDKKLTLTIPGPGTVDPTTQCFFFDDFIVGSVETGEIGALGWTANASGGTHSISVGVANHPGIYEITVSTLASRVCIELAPATTGHILPGSGTAVFECSVMIPTLSTAAEEFDFHVGLGANNGAGGMTDGLYFRYDRTTSVNWLRCSAIGGVITETSTGQAVNAGTWVRLRFEVNTAWTSADFFVDGTGVGTNNTNMPTAALFALLKAEKSVTAASSARQGRVDYTYFTMTVAR